MAKRKDVYTDEEKDEIVAHVLVQVATGRFVSRIFAEDETTNDGVKLCHQATFWQWVLEREDELGEKLARARARGVEALLDECGEIADDAVNDFLEKHDDKTGNSWWEFQREHVARSKLRIETRIKLAQMLKPKTYGPKLDLTSNGKSLSLAEELKEARQREAEMLSRRAEKGE